jgi:hypothetical protein
VLIITSRLVNPETSSPVDVGGRKPRSSSACVLRSRHGIWENRRRGAFQRGNPGGRSLGDFSFFLSPLLGLRAGTLDSVRRGWWLGLESWCGGVDGESAEPSVRGPIMDLTRPRPGGEKDLGPLMITRHPSFFFLGHFSLR